MQCSFDIRGQVDRLHIEHFDVFVVQSVMTIEARIAK